ncbi:hypothetical protein LSH36_189g00032 [Paralvinella palmiformis]|uniref:Fucosyltransferase n=1 Tax=Paralvinella palmiformis TaxID=53620 RepID=A0AAD9N580_9ANNE|nr:hypothetical protein LSH36_189g00032 [Paralvinella palmiformis]
MFIMMIHSTIVILVSLVVVPKCKTEDLMVFSTLTEIRYANLSDFDGHATYIPLINTTEVSSVDYDPVEEYLYWADTNKDIIARARLDGSDEEMLTESVHCSSITLDVESRIIYWTDTNSHTIERSDLKITDTEILIQEFLDQPGSIALDKGNGKMYWTETGSNPRIERANLDGSERKELVHMPLRTPLVLTLDTAKGKMYWADGGLNRIMSSDLDGKNRQMTYEGDITPSSMAYHGDHIYWSDLGYDISSKILKLKTSGTGVSADVVFIGVYKGVYDLKATTTKDGKEILLIAEYGLAEIDLNIEKDLGTQIWPFKNMESVAVDLDPRDDKIYSMIFTENNIKTVFRNGSNPTTLVENIEVRSTLNSMAISFVTNELFWTVNTKGIIERMSLSGENRNGYKDSLANVAGLALDEANRKVYWTLCTSPGRVQRDTYTTDGEETLVSHIIRPWAIVLDLPNSLMYISIYKESTIRVYHLNGDTVRTLEAKEKRICLTMLGDYLYFYVSGDSIYRKNKNDDSSPVKFRSPADSEFTSVKIITRCDINPCQNNGTCIWAIDDYRCICMDGITGDYCEVVNNCFVSPCENNGTCVNWIGGFNCTCTEGYSGSRCEIADPDIDNCNGVICQNNGTCVDEINKYYCTCLPGFSGDHCEIDRPNWPMVRYPHQYYGHFIHEAPNNRPKRTFLDKYEGQINLTINFRHDADVFAPYQSFFRRPVSIPYKPHAPLAAKKKMAVWPVSHCKTLSQREDYVKELSKYIGVDIFGGCGPYKCPRSRAH